MAATPAIGIALSGGGVRAAVFHLGVLARLAQDDLLEDVTFLSTVSGGSIAIGLVYTLTGERWPSSRVFLTATLPEIRRRLTTTSIQADYILRTLRRPWLLSQGRAKVIAESLRHGWGMRGLLRDLPAAPRWVINAATYETGKNWRFMPQRMGDYTLGYVRDPAFPIAEAVAASAAVPFFIGPLVLRPRDYRWWQYPPGTDAVAAGDDAAGRAVVEPHPTPPPRFGRLHLWDGGVYDNLGIEQLFKGDRFRPEVDFLIVSDAAAGLTYSWKDALLRGKRVVDIATDQVRGLRSRMIVGYFERNPGSGVYLRIGNSSQDLVRKARVDPAGYAALLAAGLPGLEARQAATLGTHLKRLEPTVFDRLYRHGWEVADGTLCTRCGVRFTHQPWRAAWSG
jgi:NTE family protein